MILTDVMDLYIFVYSFAELRKRSTLSEGEEPEVQFPFKFNPFDPSASPGCLSGHTIFVSPHPSVLNNNNSHGQLSVKEELYQFGEGFIERWSSEPKQDPDYDPIFMALNGQLIKYQNCKREFSEK